MAQEVRYNKAIQLNRPQKAHDQGMDSQTLLWLKLSLVSGFGSAHLTALEEKFPDVLPELFEMSHSDLNRLGFTEQQIKTILYPSMDMLEKAETWLSSDTHHRILHPKHPDYPHSLIEISSYPLVLFVKGNYQLLGQHQLAVVGSRNPTLSGKRNARRLVTGLANAGWCITSGMAMGIDAVSHIAALDVQGKTVAVTGSGLDIVYPKRNATLANRIVEQNGALVSEFFPGTGPKAEHFPRRNRIISGMSKGTLVVEAAIKSGSLITARFALEQGREVFAIPGNIDNPLSEGGHYLLKQGAKLTTSVLDIHEEFQNVNFTEGDIDEKNLQKSCQQHLESDKLLDSVDFEVTALDAVLERSKLPINELMAKLLEYELRGLVASVPGGYVKLGGK